MQFDLVFEGGGAKGMVFVGAIEAFQNHNHTFDRLMGTSAGSITAVLLAAGYSLPELQGALIEKTEDGRPIFETFLGAPGPFSEDDMQDSALRGFLGDLDIPGVPEFLEKKVDESLVRIMASDGRFRNVFSFIELGGWYSADAFVAWMRRCLDTGQLNGKARDFSAMSLAQFYEATGCDLTLIGADTSGASMLVLNHRTAPDLPVVWGARMSMSVPLLWQEVIWQKEWGLYRGDDISGHSVVDGGMLSNFPIELFISDATQVTNVMGPKSSENVIGFLIDESQPVEGASTPAATDSAGGGIEVGQFETVKRLNKLINTATQAHDKAVIDAFERLVVRLPAWGYGTTEFGMTDARREALINSGRKVTEAYLTKLESPSFALPREIPQSPADIANEHAIRLLG